MHALDIKLLRDFKRLWSQSLAIALVLACGVMILLTSFGMHRALDDTLTAFYDRNDFADVWANVDKAPRQLEAELTAIEGVQRVELRVEKYLVLDMPDRLLAASGVAISLPESGALPRLNTPLIRTGRLPDPLSTDEVMVSEPFAQANGFTLGDRFEVLLNGAKRSMRITGTALSPEYVYAIGPGSLMPDDANFGVLWLPEIMLASSFDMAGAFNNVAVSLSRGGDEEVVISQIEDILDAYGGTGGYGRETQVSHAFISSEINQLKSMAVVLPPIFFGISAFLVNMVIGRIIALERTEIGLLKALGYSDFHIAGHYILLAGLTAVIGVAVGWVTGGTMARAMAAQYAQYFKLPYLIFNVSYDAYAISGFLALVTAAFGALRSAWAAARLAPAIAMSPPAPPRYKRSFFDRALTMLKPSQPTMMIWRSIIRWPVRAAFSALGLSLAVSVLVASSFLISAMDEILDVSFNQSNRQDVVLMMAGDRPLSTLEDVRKLPGVMEAEGELMTAVTLRNGHREKQLAITTRGTGATLARSVDRAGLPIEPEGDGLLITTRVAEVLRLKAGDSVEVEFMAGHKETHVLAISGVVDQYFGIGAFMTRDAMAALTRKGPEISLANVTLDVTHVDAFNAAVKDTPGIAGSVRITDMMTSFQDTIDENISVMNGLFIVIAVLITVGLTYNGARIQLSERARELASLRILGFSKGEVGYILVGETMLIALAAQPLGWAIGYWISASMSAGFSSDLYTIPLVLPQANFTKASLVVLCAAFVSVLVVRRRVNRLNLVSVMKTRE